MDDLINEVDKLLQMQNHICTCATASSSQHERTCIWQQPTPQTSSSPPTRDTLFYDYDGTSPVVVRSRCDPDSQQSNPLPPIPLTNNQSSHLPLPARRNSTATVFYDYDGSAAPTVSGRSDTGAEAARGSTAATSAPSQARTPSAEAARVSTAATSQGPTPSAQNEEINHIFISGRDPQTHMHWDFDGTILHIHRSPNAIRPSSQRSAHSSYYEVGKLPEGWGDKEWEAMGIRFADARTSRAVGGRMEKMRKFVIRVFRRIKEKGFRKNGMGIWERKRVWRREVAAGGNGGLWGWDAVDVLGE